MDEIRVGGLKREDRARSSEKLGYYERNGFRGTKEADGEMRTNGSAIEPTVCEVLCRLRCEKEAGQKPVRRVSSSRAIDLKDILVLRPEWSRGDASRWLESQQEGFEEHMKRSANLFLALQLPQSPVEP